MSSQAGIQKLFPWVVASLALASWFAVAWYAPLFMDEYSFQRNVAYFVQAKSITPVFARYPPLYSYLIAPPIYVVFFLSYLFQGLPLSGLRDVQLLKTLFSEGIMAWVWVARSITMLFGAATVFIAVRFALRRHAWVGALTAAALLLFDPFGIVLGAARFGLPDMCVACLVTAAVLMCLRAMKEGTPRAVYWAAVLAGLAGSMKVNGLLALPAVCAAAGFVAPAGRRGRSVLLALLLCAAGFAAGSPSLVFSWPAYAAELRTEHGVLFGSGHLGAHGTPWVWIAGQLWRASPVISVLLLMSFVLCLARRSREDWLYLALLLPAIAVIGVLQKKTMLYFVPLFPLVAIKAGELAEWAWRRTESRWERVVAGIMLLAIFLSPAARMIGILRWNVRPDNTVLARKWIEKSIPAGTPVVLDWAYVPELRDMAECSRRVADAKAAKSRFAGEIERRWRDRPAYCITTLLGINYSRITLEWTEAKFLVTSSGCYGRFFPAVREGLPKPTDPLYDKFMARRAFYEALFQGGTKFRPVKTFSEGAGPVVRVYESTRRNP